MVQSGCRKFIFASETGNTLTTGRSTGMELKTIIALFCYKRTATLKQTVEALLKNPECADMEIMFFCDGYKNEHDKEEVSETRRYVKSVTGFKKIHIQHREKNYAAGLNICTAVIYLSQYYDQFIVVEDDVVFTSNGIRFLLDALAFYKNDCSVFAITGYCFPLEVNNYPYDSIMHKRFCSYGWASWKDRITKVKWDAASLQYIIDTTPGFKRRLNEEGMDLFRRLRKQVANKLSTHDIQIQTHIALHNLYVVYPVVSKLMNVGFDVSATHTYGVNFLITPLDDGKKRVFRFCNADNFDAKLSRQLKRPYRFTFLVARKMYNSYVKYMGKMKRRFV